MGQREGQQPSHQVTPGQAPAAQQQQSSETTGADPSRQCRQPGIKRENAAAHPDPEQR